MLGKLLAAGFIAVAVGATIAYVLMPLLAVTVAVLVTTTSCVWLAGAVWGLR